ncbi:MAG: protein phosphatase 2C domain-containing protein [Cyanobacteria bacterium P01_H01_bin.162]
MPSPQLPPVRRFLWAQGPASLASVPAGTVLAGRYQVIDFPLVQDQQPQSPPPPLASVPPLAVPYLALSPFSVNIPRPFTQVLHPDGQSALLLLEEIPLQEAVRTPQLLPTLAKSWPGATALHQLAWLRQIAKLWQPCVNQQLAHTLLDWQHLRVEGEDLRLLCLEAQATAITLVDLGQQWQQWIAAAAPAIRDYLTRLTNHLIADHGSAAGLVYSLVQAIAAISSQQTVTVQLATASDQGPTRQRNEDACYPESGAVRQVAMGGRRSAPALVVVCDGVGGHQGGDVASHLAIAEVSQRLNPLLKGPAVDHRQVVAALKEAIIAANQAITIRNDADQRQERDRMGTTIVVGLVYGGRLYVAHLGDSRAYRVRSHSCRQITLDDDVAAREMRLGLGLYQDALQQPGAGALVQALGMADASHLHPTVKLYPLATDSVVLLCSDGLSDNDLIDHLWSSELVPVLNGEIDVGSATQRLIGLANTYNGHDNVTVGLLRLKVEPADRPTAVPVALADQPLLAPPPLQAVAPAPSLAAPATALPPAPRHRPPRSGLRWLTGVVMVALVSLGSALGWQWLSRRNGAIAPLEPATESGETLSPSAVPPTIDEADTAAELAVGDYLQIQQLPDPSAAATLLTTQTPPTGAPPAAVDLPERLLSIGSIVQVNSRQRTPDGRLWVRLKVCSTASDTAEPVPPPAATESAELPPEPRDRLLPLAQAGDQGWLLQADLPVFAEQLLDTSVTQQGLCTD